jgi:gamma-glutamyltranspeptidase/glutathione hydrolase
MTSSSASERVRVLSTARGSRAVLTAATPISANVGLSLLARGGNVFDAALGAALAETVVLPPKCGMAGDLVALVVRSGEEWPTAMLSIGQAPPELCGYASKYGLPTTGAWSVGMPGSPAGYAKLSTMGVLSLAEQVQPAIDLAYAGFPWPDVAAELTSQARQRLIEENPNGVPYLPDGRPHKSGAQVRLPGLAAVLEEFIDRRELLFSGPVGDAIIETLSRHGRTTRQEDLMRAHVEMVRPSESLTGTRAIWTTPSPTHGPWLLEAMTQWGLDPTPRGLFDAIERTVERRRRLLYDDRSSGTSVVTAADAAGNAIVLVHSNSYQRYGSGVVVAPYGLVLSNRAGRGFSSDPLHPNFCSEGRRPATTLHAWAVGHEEGPGVALMGATPGGENQMRWNAQVLADVIAGCDDPGSLVCRPHWGAFDTTIRIEESHELVKSELCREGYRTEVVADYSLRSAQQVLRLGRSGDVVAGADPRTQAAARCW